MRTWSGGFFDANGVKYTRAAPISAATFTAVIVTLPTRGSFTSRAINSESTRWISASIRLLRCASAKGLLQRPSDFDARVALDLVAHPYVLVVLHADTALGTRTHFARFIFEAPQRLERTLENHHVVPQHADRVVAFHEALG